MLTQHTTTFYDLFTLWLDVSLQLPPTIHQTKPRELIVQNIMECFLPLLLCKMCRMTIHDHRPAFNIFSCYTHFQVFPLQQCAVDVSHGFMTSIRKLCLPLR